MPDDRAWWRDYFGDDFFELHVDLFPEELSRREVAGMVELLQLPLGGAILDVPCGWGRHTALLSGQGYSAIGSDLSYDLLKCAGQLVRCRRYTRAPIRGCFIRRCHQRFHQSRPFPRRR